MESVKIDEAQCVSNETSMLIEMGRVSEETKGQHNPNFESLMFPSTLG
jgi:hypothetical protein